MNRRRTVWILIALLILAAAVPSFIACRNAAAINSRIESSLQGVTRVRVWAAGIRTSSGGFCPCAPVPKPERVLYESTDAAQLGLLISHLRARPHLSLKPPVPACGTLTLDFLQGEKIVLSVHPLGDNVRSTSFLIPLSGGNQDQLEAWLARADIPRKLEEAQRDFSRPREK